MARKLSPAKIAGTLLVLSTCLFSTPLSVFESETGLMLALLISPLFLVHVLASREGLTKSQFQCWPYPLLPFLLVLGSMMISSIANAQTIFHAMGPGLWIWACCIVTVASFWKMTFISAICRAAFFPYLLVAIAHLFSWLATPETTTAIAFRENLNLLNVQLASMAIVGFGSSSKLSKILAGAVISIFYLLFNTLAGIGALLLSLMLFSKYRKYFYLAGIIAALSIGYYKFTTESGAFFLRKEIFRTAFHQGMESPLTGIGFDRPIYHPMTPSLSVNHSHNSLLNFFRITGICGLLAFTYLLLTIYRSRTRLPTSSLLLILFYLIWGTVDDFMVWYGTLLFFALACASQDETIHNDSAGITYDS